MAKSSGPSGQAQGIGQHRVHPDQGQLQQDQVKARIPGAPAPTSAFASASESYERLRGWRGPPAQRRAYRQPSAQSQGRHWACLWQSHLAASLAALLLTC